MEVELPPSSPPSPAVATRQKEARKPLKLGTDDSIRKAQEGHAWLMLMVQTPYDHGCDLARPYFNNVAKSWVNITFGIVDAETAPLIAKKLMGRSSQVPAYGLLLPGMNAPISYRGGWSERSIDKWLHQQSQLLQPVEIEHTSQLEKLVGSQSDGLAVLGLLPPRLRSKRTLEVAARALQLQVVVGLAGEAVAKEIGAPFPSVVVTHGDCQPWAVLRGPITRDAIDIFLSLRALPIVAAIGDSNRRHATTVREHPARLRAMLVHRSGARGVHAESERALDEARTAATQFSGVVLFVSYDFFDNDPEQFAAFELFEADLPTLVVVHDRGGLHERKWRPSSTATGWRLDATEIAMVVQRAVAESGEVNSHPSRWDDLPAPACVRPGLDDSFPFREEL